MIYIINRHESDFLKDLFLSFHEKKIEYVVLRNSADLPLNNSNDVDIYVSQRDYQKSIGIFYEVGKNAGFERVEHTRFQTINCYTLYKILDDLLISVKVDFFKSLNNRGISTVSSEFLLRNRTLNEAGIFILNDLAESLLNVLKMFVTGGVIKDDYLNKLRRLDKDNLVCVLNDLDNVYLRSSLLTIYNGGNVDFSWLDAYCSRGNQWLQNFKDLFVHYLIEVHRTFRGRKIFLAFYGPDGSGKSTVINRIAQEKTSLRSSNQRFVIKHHRPRRLPHLSGLSPKDKSSQGNSPVLGKPSNRLVSWGKLMYYSLDYLLVVFDLLYVSRKDKILIYDRYYLDFMLNPERSAMKGVESLAHIMYKFVPNPLYSYFLIVDPRVATKRKSELTLSEYQKYNAKYSAYWQSNGLSIINNESIDKTIQKVLRDVMYSLTDEL